MLTTKVNFTVYKIYTTDFGGELPMENARLIEQFKSELRQALKNFEDGKGIPLEEFDWGLPMHVAESRTEYRVQNEA